MWSRTFFRQVSSLTHDIIEDDRWERGRVYRERKAREKGEKRGHRRIPMTAAKVTKKNDNLFVSIFSSRLLLCLRTKHHPTAHLFLYSYSHSKRREVKESNAIPLVKSNVKETPLAQITLSCSNRWVDNGHF